jgi:hypothetical protein
MIPQKIRALFDFIDFLDKNKSEYIEKYIPLCNELKELDKQRSTLKPKENYKDKQSYDHIQEEIKEKFEPITNNIYKPITNRLHELGIWSGDDVYTSIWNNNISEIEDFKRNFSQEDAEQIFHYKNKYLHFRTETNNDFLCLSFVFSNLDEIYKALFDFFKDTQENEFEPFEAKTIEIKDFNEVARNLKENIGKNVIYSIPTETIFGKRQTQPSTEIADIKNEFNVFNMGDKIEVGSISNNSGQIIVGQGNKTEVNTNDNLSKKSFNWQKWGIIIGTIIAIIAIIVTIIYSNN